MIAKRVRIRFCASGARSALRGVRNALIVTCCCWVLKPSRAAAENDATSPSSEQAEAGAHRLQLTRPSAGQLKQVGDVLIHAGSDPAGGSVVVSWSAVDGGLRAAANDQQLQASGAVEMLVPPEFANKKLSYEWLELRGGRHLLVLRLGDEQPYEVFLLAGNGPGKPPTLLLKGRTGKTDAALVDVEKTGKVGDQRVYLTRSPLQPNFCGRVVPYAVDELDPEQARFRPIAVPVLSATQQANAQELLVASSEGDAEGAFSVAQGPLLELSLNPVLGGLARRLGSRGIDGATDQSMYPHAALEIDQEQVGEALALLVHTRATAAASDREGLEPSQSGTTPEDAPLQPSVPGGWGSPEEEGTPELFLVAGENTFRVRLPEPLPAVVLVPIPEGARAECLAVAMGAQAWATEVTVLVRSEELGNKSEQQLVRALDGPHADRAGRALAARGVAARGALLSEVRRLSPKGRQRAERVALALGEEPFAAYEAKLVSLGSEPEEARARTRLSALGDAGYLALVAALTDARPKEEQRLARALGELFPDRAPEGLMSRLSQRSPARRLEIRRVVSAACQRPEALRRAEQLLVDVAQDRRARSELLRALAPCVKGLSVVARRSALELLETAKFHEAYRLSAVLLELAPTEPEARALLDDWLLGASPVLSSRQRAALRVQLLTYARERGFGFEGLHAAAEGLLVDAEMRVREASAMYFQVNPDASALAPLSERLKDDHWPEVRGQVVLALGALRSEEASLDSADNAIARALARDSDPLVRAAAARAFDQSPSERALRALRRSLSKDPSSIVRADAARSLGLVCDQESLQALTHAALALRKGAEDEGDVRLGLQAAAAVARLGPSDLDARLRSLTEESVPGPLRARVQQSISSVRGLCATAAGQ